jgi:hypothetical protein
MRGRLTGCASGLKCGGTRGAAAGVAALALTLALGGARTHTQPADSLLGGDLAGILDLGGILQDCDRLRRNWTIRIVCDCVPTGVTRAR